MTNSLPEDIGGGDGAIADVGWLETSPEKVFLGGKEVRTVLESLLLLFLTANPSPFLPDTCTREAEVDTC
ncbi:MAG: hypothetical protein K6T90_20810 [Leptolyngbyaceae cyanobacterium HOT.MB2.61]|nr:hypothetical protein [Leptolyngbyaceae cyanobacterium HOT.MB2.61]